MHHACSWQSMAFKVHRQLVMRASRMQDHRQFVPLRQLKLRFQHPLLLVELRIVAIQIQSNLTYRHQLLWALIQHLLQLVQAVITMLFNNNGM